MSLKRATTWSCPTCRRAVSIYDVRCPKCGARKPA